MLSVFQLRSYGPLPVTPLLDVWVVAFCLFALGAVSRRVVLLVFAIAAVAFVRMVVVLATSSPLLDAVQANKWLIYLLAFALAVDRVWTRTTLLARASVAVVLLATVKSVVAFVVLGSRERSGLFVENNFEIPLFCGLILTIYTRLGRYRAWLVVAAGALVLSSGSRSGAIAYLGLVLFAVSQSRIRDSFARYVAVLLLIGITAVPIWIFQTRAETSTQLDRLNFLEVFQGETSGWSPFAWLFGTVPITPLSGGACRRLGYYTELFSSTGDGTCYSVILHAFVLRIVFDAGLLGLLFVFLATWICMRRGNVARATSLALLYIAATNSLSVSGLNNSYVAIPIIIAITLAAGTHRDVESGIGRKARWLAQSPTGP